MDKKSKNTHDIRRVGLHHLFWKNFFFRSRQEIISPTIHTTPIILLDEIKNFRLVSSNERVKYQIITMIGSIIHSKNFTYSILQIIKHIAWYRKIWMIYQSSHSFMMLPYRRKQNILLSADIVQNLIRTWLSQMTNRYVEHIFC